MDRIRALDIKKRQLVTAIYGLRSETFLTQGLQKINLFQMLFLYLKEQGYDNVIFYNTTNGFYSYDRKSLESVQNFSPKQEDTPATKSLPVLPKDKRPMGNSRRLAQANEGKPATPAAPDSIRFSSEQTHQFYQINKRMNEDAIMSLMLFILKEMNNTVLIISTDDKEEFSPVHARRFASALDDINISLHSLRQSYNNKLIIDYRASSLHTFIDAFRARSSVFTTDDFRKLFFISNNLNTEDCLNKASVFAIGNPHVDEVHNLINYKRINESMKVDWLTSSEIEEELCALNLNLTTLENSLKSIHSLTREELIDKKILLKKEIEFDEKLLKEKLAQVKGQEDIIDVITSDIKNWTRRPKRKKPLSFFSVGTSGTGKSFTANMVQEALATNGFKVVDFRMNEFQEEHRVSNLIGSPPGYVGSTTRPELFEKIDESKRLVIIFDEIEKAHPKIIQALLGLLNDGVMSWNSEIRNFNDCIIFLTSNLEREKVVAAKNDFLTHFNGTKVQGLRHATLGRTIRDILAKSKNSQALSPEFCGRVDRFLVYNTLDAKDIIEVAIETIRISADEFGLKIKNIAPTYLAKIAKDYSNDPSGVRPLKVDVDTVLGELMQNDYENIPYDMELDDLGFPHLVPSKDIEGDETLKEKELLINEAIKHYTKEKRAILQFNDEGLTQQLSQVYCQQDNAQYITEEIANWIAIPQKTKPLNLFFVGTSGTGKTLSAKLITKSLKDYGYEFLQINMNEYSSKGDVWKLLGSPSGFKGSDDVPSLKQAREQTDKLVILFDEIEKAHPEIHTTIMTLLDEGKMGFKNETLDFCNCIIIFTSNLAMEELVDKKRKLVEEGHKINRETFQKPLKDILYQHGIKREVLGRIKAVYVYNPLDYSAILNIVIAEVRKLGSQYHVFINRVDPQSVHEIALNCQGDGEGARIVRSACENRFARAIRLKTQQEERFDIIYNAQIEDFELVISDDQEEVTLSKLVEEIEITIKEQKTI